MNQKLLCLALAIFISSSAFSDYYLVGPTGEMHRAEKTQRDWEPISEQPSHWGSFSPDFIDTVWFHDPDIPGWYYPNRDSNTVVMQYFNTPYPWSACLLVAVGMNYYSPGWAEFYVWQGPDFLPDSTSALEAYLDTAWEYDDASDDWAKWPTVLHGPDSIGSDEPDDGVQRECWIHFDPELDIGTDYVWVGYRIIDHYNPEGQPYGGKPWPLSDGWVDPAGRGFHWTPYRSWMFRVQEESPLHLQWTEYGDMTGDWEMKYVVKDRPIYQLWIVFDKLLGTYDIGDRLVSAEIVDFGVPAESSGVSEAWLFYYINDDPATLDSTEMVLVDGTIVDGTWEATIPAQLAETKVIYYISAFDIQGLNTETEHWSYYIGEGHPGHILFHIGSLIDYSSHDPVRAVRSMVDVWDEGLRGVADSTVFDYYTTGAGEKGIIWLDWTGTTMVEDTAYIRKFLDAGGSLLLSSQDLPADFDLADDPGDPYGHWTANPLTDPFPYDCLQLRSGTDDYEAIDTMSSFLAHGITGDPISGSLEQISITPAYNWTGIFDSLSAGFNELFYGPNLQTIGFRYKGIHKLVFLYWHFHEIGTGGGKQFEPDTSSQNEFMRNALTWLGLTIGVHETEHDFGRPCFLAQNNPNPVRGGRTSISYFLPGAEMVSLVVYDIAGRRVRILDQ